MSLPALLSATESRLRTALSLDSSNCAIQPDGRPPADAGQWYYAVHELPGSPSPESPHSDDRYYGLGITITAKMAYSPGDRRGARIVASNELLERADAAVVALHGDYISMNAANALISGFGVTTNGFVEPLKHEGGAEGPIQEKGPEWVRARAKVQSGERFTVLALALRFGQARRIRKTQ